MSEPAILAEVLATIRQNLIVLYYEGVFDGIRKGEDLARDSILIEEEGTYFPIAEDVKREIKASILRSIRERRD